VVVVAALAALSACGTLSDSDRDFKPAAPAPAAEPAPAAAAPAAPSPTVAALDPLTAPPPPANGMLVPAPGETETSQRVPLGTLVQPAAPQAPRSILQPPTQTAQAQVAQPQTAPVQAAPVQAAPPRAAAPVPAPQPAPVAPPPAAPAMQMAQAQLPTPKPTAPAQPVPRLRLDDTQHLPAGSIGLVPPQPADAVRLHMPDGSTAPVTPRDDNDTVVISSATAQPQVQSQAREFIPASLTPAPVIRAPGPGEIPLTAGEINTVQRFEILKRLEDESLITHDEYVRRRAANIGALLPYTHDPAGVGLERPVPSADAIVARLVALRRSFEMRAITAEQHALERTMILNALLPEAPMEREEPLPPPKDMIEGAAMAGHLEALREKTLITTDELNAEKSAIQHAVETGLLPSQELQKPAKRTATASAKPASAKTAKAPEASAMDTEITGPVLHIASYRTEASAMQGWQEVTSKNKALLANLKPIVRRVDLGQKGIFYRLMAGTFSSLSEAEATCVKLKEANQFCRASADGS
jgi:hypothetical protein